MDGGISAVGSIFNATWRIATVVYELKAVGEQTRDLLDTTSQVSSTLQHAQVLRRQRSDLLNVTEKKWIDDVLQASDKAVGNVAALIEPARVDLQTNCEKIRFFTRGQFILRDSPKVQVQLGRLGIAAQGLNTAMGVLCARDASTRHPSDGGMVRKIDSGPSENELKPPPSYEAVELLDRRRESVMRRRASKLSLAMNPDAEVSKHQPLIEDQRPSPMVNFAEIQPTPMTSPQFDPYTRTTKQKPLEEDPNTLPIVNVTEVLPTPMTSPLHDPYAESDGLQVVQNHFFWNHSTPDLHSRGLAIYPYPTTTTEQSSRSSFFSPHTPDSNYRPYRPPDPNNTFSRTHDPSSQAHWQQRPAYNYPPPPPRPTSSSSSAYTPYRPPDQSSSHPPYSPNYTHPPTTATTSSTPYNHTQNPNYPYFHTPQYNSAHSRPHSSSTSTLASTSSTTTLLSPTSTSTSTSTSNSHPHSYFPPTNTNTTTTHQHRPNSYSTSTTTLSPSLSLSPTTTSSHSLSPDPSSTSFPQPQSASRRNSFSSIQTSESLSVSAPRQKGRERGRAWLEHQSDRL